jgi:hypothetical protein
VLEKILNEQIAEAQSKLQATQRALPRMLSAFNDSRSVPKVTQHKGKKELYQMYIEQMEQPDRELHFIRSVADVPYFGIESMKEIRFMAPAYKKRRFGITPIVFYSPSDPYSDSKTRLKRTWLPKASYTSPVEWVVTGDLVQIISFKGDGAGISIKNPEIAESFRQLLKLFSEYIKKDPEYIKNPKFVQDYTEKSREPTLS